MDRRKFFKVMGGATAAAVVAPSLISQAVESLPEAVSFARATPTAVGGYMPKVHWDEILDKPLYFEPVVHHHTVEDVYGYVEVHDAISKLLI